MWKLLTSIVADEIYNHLVETDLLSEEQKGYCRNSRGTKDQFYKGSYKKLQEKKGWVKHGLDRFLKSL